MSAYVNQAFAVLVVGVCAVMLLRLLLGERRRAKFDATLIRWGKGLRDRAIALRHWRRRREDAARLAEEAILRARRNMGRDKAHGAASHRVDKDGNVIRPEAFKGPRKPH